MKQEKVNITQEKRLEKALFQELKQVRKINNLTHKLTVLLQKYQELVVDNYSQLELELNYLQKELFKLDKN